MCHPPLRGWGGVSNLNCSRAEYVNYLKIFCMEVLSLLSHLFSHLFFIGVDLWIFIYFHYWKLCLTLSKLYSSKGLTGTFSCVLQTNIANTPLASYYSTSTLLKITLLLNSLEHSKIGCPHFIQYAQFLPLLDREVFIPLFSLSMIFSCYITNYPNTQWHGPSIYYAPGFCGSGIPVGHSRDDFILLPLSVAGWVLLHTCRLESAEACSYMCLTIYADCWLKT